MKSEENLQESVPETEAAEETELEEMLKEEPAEEIAEPEETPVETEKEAEGKEEESELPKLIISKEVNEKIWDRGIEKPPRKIRVRAAKDSDGNVTVYLAEEK